MEEGRFFEKEFDCVEYKVLVTHNHILYRVFENGKQKFDIPLLGLFRNTWDEASGKIVIENIYMRLNATFPHEYKQMFDFIARGFQLDLNPKKVPA